MATYISKFKLPRNPYLLFLPFLIFYILIVLFLHSDTLWGDEGRYIMYAQNLLHGFYSGPDPFLSCGPGYPVILMPFVALHWPFMVIKLMNPVFYYLSVVFLYKTLRRYASFKMAMGISLFWACYYNAYENLPLVLTETFGIFLVTALIWSLSKAFDPEPNSKKYIYLSGFLFGYIALTKVIFGYVMLFMLLGSLALWLFNRKRENFKKSVIILIIALITTIPYLIYTYNLTGRAFYWSTVSGNNLYWMSTPYKNEYGSWMANPKFGKDSITPLTVDRETYAGGIFNFRNREHHFEGYEDSVKRYHKDDYEEIFSYNTVIGRDDAFKKIAIKNIRDHPFKFIENCISNMGRILFNFPYSYKLQSPGTLFRLPLPGIVAVLMLFCFIPTVMNWRKIDFSIRFLLTFVFIYLSGSTVGSAETRMFTIAVPVLLFWVTFILKKTIRINFNFANHPGEIETRNIQ